jgi:hypothetical protein
MASSSDKPESWPSGKIQRRWWGVCSLFAAALFISQLVEIPSRSALRGYDNTFNYLWLRSAMVDHDWDFRNDLIQCNTLIPEYRASALTLPVSSTGLIPNKYGMGWAVLTLPFYLVADLIVALGRGLGLWTLQRDGFNAVYQVCIQIGHAALALVALSLAVRTIGAWLGADAPGRRGTLEGGAKKRSGLAGGFARPSTGTAAFIGVATVWAASPLLYYQTVNLSMSHGGAFFAVVVMAYGLVRGRGLPQARWPWVVAGAGWGLAVITRFPLGLFGLLVAWALAERAVAGRAWARPAFWAALGAAPFVALQLWGWHVVYGQWLVFGYGVEGEGFHWSQPQLWSSLFSPWHGLFYWHPFLMIGMAGMMAWAIQMRGQGRIWATAFFALIYVNAAWWCWWFASAFGNRGCDAALLPLMAGVAWCFQRALGRWKTALWAVAIAAASWNFYVVVLYRTGAISRSAPVTWQQMIEASVRLPHAMGG